MGKTFRGKGRERHKNSGKKGHQGRRIKENETVDWDMQAMGKPRGTRSTNFR